VPDLFRLDVLSSLISICAIVIVGRKKWWGWLFNIANVFLLTILNIRYGLWALHFLNVGLLCMFAYNAWLWKSKSKDI
jgi:nicotinamide riboside transporter PnuC